MIITKKWLNEWIDIEDIESEKICETLNSIGLEVESLTKVRIPSKIVVGYVKECIKHPDADKLSVCQVDIGDEVVQIVCGAKNVKKDQFVPVAIIGAILGKDFKIKKAKLRGVESNGMICSSKEIGLPELGNGILELDDSIGELIIGKELNSYELLNDDVIEIELTANRGDCLSVYGVARDLSAALDREMYQIETINEKEGGLGIGRVLSLSSKDECKASLLYKVFEKKELSNPLLLNLRLAFVDKKQDDVYGVYKTYTTHSTGVIVKLYSCDKMMQEEDKKCEIRLEKNDNGAEYIKISDKISYIGFDENRDFLPTSDTKKILFEESYIDPYSISEVGKVLKIKNDKTFYHSSRGSEPDLNFGLDYFKLLMGKYGIVEWYNGCEVVDNEPQMKAINVYISKIDAIVGQKIEKSQVVKILQNLGFFINMKDDSDLLGVKIPVYRHDVKNAQDITEEIVRIIGIDNIISKPLEYEEFNNQNKAYKNYKKRLYFRKKASYSGFFEVTNYVFTDGKKLNRLMLQRVDKEKELINPVNNELDGIRSSLLLGLLETASRNIKYGKKSIRLFEIGTVFDKSRKESLKFSFIFSGEMQRASLRNHGKPNEIDFFNFAQKISSIIGEFEVEKSDKCKSFLSPYESGNIIKNGKNIGFIGRIHIDIENEFDLLKTYFCEIEFDKLSSEDVKVKSYSKYPSIERDFSFLLSKDLEYKTIKDAVYKDKSKEIVDIYPIDRFESSELGDNVSITVKFIIQSHEKTLNEDEVNNILTPILEKLKSKGIEIR